MPPDEDQKKQQGTWGKYRNLIIGVVVVAVLVFVGFMIKSNSAAGDSVTLTSLSNQLQNVQATLINQATAIGKIPLTDSVPDLSGVQNSMAQIMAQVQSVQEGLANLTAFMNITNLATQEELAILAGNISGMNMTALNETVWENHLMLVALCESLNITGVP